MHLAHSTFLLGLIFSVPAAAQDWLHDDFEDGVLDPSKWETILPYGFSAITESNGEVEFKSRGWLLPTTALGDPGDDFTIELRTRIPSDMFWVCLYSTDEPGGCCEFPTESLVFGLENFDPNSKRWYVQVRGDHVDLTGDIDNNITEPLFGGDTHDWKIEVANGVLRFQLTDPSTGQSAQIECPYTLDGQEPRRIAILNRELQTSVSHLLDFRLSLPDCNGNGIDDEQEVLSGTSQDCNANGIPDTCDIDGDPSLDLDGNGILDSCEATNIVWAQSPINGRFYTSLPPMTWAEAEAIAVSYGGHLTTIRSQEENDWVASFYGHDQAWIGLNDVALEGSFEWTSGDGTGYTNWAPGSPGGFAPDQDYVGISGLDGQWNDWFATSLYPGVVEVDGADCDGDTRPDAYEIATGPDNDWNGDGVLDVCVAPNYCVGAPNSAGPDGGVMAISGSPLIGDNDVELRATGLPGSQWSFFIMSRTQANVPGFGGSQGTLCLGAPQYRFNRSSLGEIAQTTPLGVRSLALDLTNLPQGVVMLPGETWNFQLWYRDQNPGQTSNTTDGISVMFR